MNAGRGLTVIVGMVVAMTVAAQDLTASESPAPQASYSMAPAMARLVLGSDEIYTPLGAESAVPSCYRIGRCSALDLYRFRDRPNRLLRLAPETPLRPPATEYIWILLPATPAENIIPKFQAASQVRE